MPCRSPCSWDSAFKLGILSTAAETLKLPWETQSAFLSVLIQKFSNNSSIVKTGSHFPSQIVLIMGMEDHYVKSCTTDWPWQRTQAHIECVGMRAWQCCFFLLNSMREPRLEALSLAGCKPASRAGRLHWSRRSFWLRWAKSEPVLTVQQAGTVCESIPFLVSPKPRRIFYLHYYSGIEMRLLNRLWEGKKRKTHDHHFWDINKSCKGTTTTSGNCILQRKLCERSFRTALLPALHCEV